MNHKQLATAIKEHPALAEAWADRVLKAAASKPKVKAPRSQRPGATRKRERETAAQRRQRKVYAEVDARSGGGCEHAFAGVYCMNEATEHDHFWGRGKAEESVETVWHLCKFHHDNKTANDPDRAHWIERFKRHCYVHGYGEQMARCERALALEFAQHPEARGAARAEGER
jgi:hypothetical protein